MNAVADMILQEMNVDPTKSLSNSLDMSMKRRLGEELIVDKIHKIFDEVAREN